MSIAERITPHLPYLRRFARALSGSQERGDGYVLATLEALISDPHAFPELDDARVALYAYFLKVWNSIYVGDGAATVSKSSTDRKLDILTPRSRQTFLLSSVEGFTAAQVAQIMGCGQQTVNELLQKAGEEIAGLVATDVLIVEDEPLIAMDLESMLGGLGHKVTAIARTHKEAIAAVKRNRPGLVLADIQLADGSSGLEAVNEILSDLNVPVIFITAFPEKLLTGERPEPTFLITKPFEPETVRAIISQALFFDTNATLPSQKQPAAGSNLRV